MLECLRITGLLALLGFSLVAMAAYAIFTLRTESPYCYIGAECGESRAWNILPLPQPSEGEQPMAIDSIGMCDYSGYVIFRATPQWQEAFRNSQTRPTPWHMADAPSSVTNNIVDYQEVDARIREFVGSRTWEHFHQCRAMKRGKYHLDCIALRDASGEYMLLYFCDF